MRTDDGSIIQECLDGKPGAFGILVDKYKAGIYAFVYTELHNFHDAQDVTQEVFLQAYRGLRNLRRWESFAFWLYRIARNLCKKWVRTQSRRPDSEFIADQGRRVMEFSSSASSGESQMSESLQEALDSLPDVYREVLMLHYFGGMTIKNIARSTGTSPGAIGMRLSRARAQLREEMTAMMDTAFEEQRLQANFTFRVVEAVKRIKINPMPRMAGVPLGLSLAVGIIITVLSINPNMSVPDYTAIPAGLPILVKTRVLRTGEIPVDILKIDEISVIASKRADRDDREPQFQTPRNTSMLAPQAEGGTWTEKAEMPAARVELSACAVNGKIYTIGGWAGKALSTVEEYDPATDTWTRKADMPTARYWLSVSSVNGKIYAIGGAEDAADRVNFSTVEEYDPVKDKWTEKADMPTARYWLSASSVNGKIYAIGGLRSNPLKHFSTVEEYDPVRDKWTTKASLPRKLHTLSTSVANGKIYAFAGVDGGVIIPTVYEYDPVKDKWTAKANMPTVQWRVSTSTVNGRIYAIGGLDDTFRNNPDPKSVSTVAEYDPVADKWTEKEDMPISRYDHACSAVGGKIYVFGGWGHDDNRFIGSSVLEYDTGFSGRKVDPKGKLPTKWGKVKSR